MKKISNFLIIVLIIATVYFISCSKKSSSASSTLNCSTPSACIVNTWYPLKYLANYNGNVVTIYARGGNSNLANFDNVSWVFENNNTWYNYSSSTIVFDEGTWKILPDSTVEINSTYPDTFAITSISPSAFNINIPFNHNYPNDNIVGIASVSGLDTSKITSVVATFSTGQ